jgi:hypothetical protein
MQTRIPNRWRLPAFRLGRPGWLRDEQGATALEFAIVGLPFFLFVLGIMGLGLYFFATTSLEYGAEAAARKIRTGEANNDDMTVQQFRQLVCDEAGSSINCGKLSIIVQHASSWSGITPQSCIDAKSGMAGSTGSSGELISKYSGEASDVVLVTLCYQWDLANDFSFLGLGSGSDGSGPAILQAAAAFKSEPYNG